MKGGKTYEEMLESRTPASQKKVLKETERLQKEYQGTRIRHDWDRPQTEWAASSGVSQPFISKSAKGRGSRRKAVGV